MTLRFSTVRIVVFLQWLITLMMLGLSFAYAIVTSLRTISEAIDSIQLVAAVVIPQLSVIVTFYLSETTESVDASLPRAGLWIILTCTTVYHVIFMIMSLTLIAFSHKPIGASAELLVKIMGILSPLGIAPVAKLFAAPRA